MKVQPRSRRAPDRRLAAARRREGAGQRAHLFGEPASARRVEGELSLTPALPRFTRYPDYRFQIGERLPEPYQEQLARRGDRRQGDRRRSISI